MPEEKDKNGENASENAKAKILTAEEIQAIAKKAEESLKVENEDVPKEEPEIEDPTTDPNNLDTEKTLKYIDKLKDENAKRRIANKKSEEKLDKLSKQLTEATEALNAASQRLKEFDDKTEEQKAKERSDLEAAQKTINSLNEKIVDLETSNTKNQQLLAETNKRVQLQERENMIVRLVQEKDATFSSDFERDGLVQSLSSMDADGFELNNEEVIYKVVKFITDKKASEDKTTPGPGPSSRKTQTPIGDEVKALLAKKTLSADEKTRLNELVDLTGKV